MSSKGKSQGAKVHRPQTSNEGGSMVDDPVQALLAALGEAPSSNDEQPVQQTTSEEFDAVDLSALDESDLDIDELKAAEHAAQTHPPESSETEARSPKFHKIEIPEFANHPHQATFHKLTSIFPTAELESDYTQIEKVAVIGVTMFGQAGFIVIPKTASIVDVAELADFVADQLEGHLETSFRSEQIEIEKVDFVDMAISKNAIFQGFDIQDQEVLVSFFASERQITQPEMVKLEDETVEVSVDELFTSEEPGFAIYVYLPILKRFYVIGFSTRALTQEHLDKLARFEFKTVRIKNADIERFRAKWLQHNVFQ